MNVVSTMSTFANSAMLPQAQSGPVYVYRFSIWSFLAQVLFCAIPPTVLIGLGRAELAGKAFWLLLGMVVGRGLLMGRRDELLCLAISTAPFLSLLRSYVFYNVIIAVFVLVIVFYALSGSARITQTIRQFPLFIGVIAWVVIYYGLSFYNTRDYSVNLRLFEFAFTIFTVLLLSRNRVLLGAAFMGNLLSAWMIGAAMLPHMGTSERLGIIAVEGRLLGNPVQLGLPLAFGFLALVLDSGRWLNLQRRPFLRWSMVIVTAVLLALTTSRASWLVAAVGVLVLFLFGKRQRSKLLWLALAGVLGISAILASPYSGILEKGWDRTFGEKYSVRKRTSGRSDQWMVSRYAFTRSIETTLHGYGPGTGPQTYARYSPEVPGVRYAVGRKVALHSLFMQMLVETGLIGLGCFVVWLFVVMVKAFLRLNENGILAFACFFGYFFTVISVSGSDINSGILLGMALAGTAGLGITGAIRNVMPSNKPVLTLNVEPVRKF